MSNSLKGQLEESTAWCVPPTLQQTTLTERVSAGNTEREYAPQQLHGIPELKYHRREARPGFSYGSPDPPALSGAR